MLEEWSHLCTSRYDPRTWPVLSKTSLQTQGLGPLLFLFHVAAKGRTWFDPASQSYAVHGAAWSPGGKSRVLGTVAEATRWYLLALVPVCRMWSGEEAGLGPVILGFPESFLPRRTASGWLTVAFLPLPGS